MSKKKGKHPGGRPTVITPEVLSKLEYAFSRDCTDTEACFYAGISEAAFYHYQLEHPEFKERKEALKSKPVMQAREVVIDGIVGKPAEIDPETRKIIRGEIPANPELALRYLERKKKDEFSLRSEHTGPNGKPLANPYDGLSLEEMKKLREERLRDADAEDDRKKRNN